MTRPGRPRLDPALRLTARLAVPCRPELEAVLRERAEREGVSLAELARRLIRRGLDAA